MMNEKHEWNVPISWMLDAVNMYLGTVTMPLGSHKCVAIEQPSNNYQTNVFRLTIERETENVVIAKP